MLKNDQFPKGIPKESKISEDMPDPPLKAENPPISGLQRKGNFVELYLDPWTNLC